MLDRKQPIYMLTVEQFSDLVRDLITEKQISQNNEQTDTTDNNEDMMTVESLSEFLHCSQATVFNHRKKGWLPQPYQVGRKVVWKKSEVVEFLKTPVNKRKRVA